MSGFADLAGNYQVLTRRIKRILASSAVAAALALGAWTGLGGELKAGGETRTISLYHMHTRESLTVTYMVNGRYVPSAMQKINVLLRDWRRNEVIRIDPKTIDLMWELHADLGSKEAVHIVCGYRSPKTNSFLKRIGRNVARQSQHMVGRAIDLFFPDVATTKIRNAAMYHKVGGVGYYSGRNGFVHIDSGRVRHWPRISASQFAQFVRDGARYSGRRMNRGDQIMVATREDGKSKRGKPDQNFNVASAYEGVDGDDEDDSAAPIKNVPAPRAKPALIEAAVVAEADPVPLPKPKPIEVLIASAMNDKSIVIEQASAPPPERTNFAKKPSPVADNLGVVEAAETLIEDPTPSPASNVAAKGSFAEALRDGTAEGTPLIKPLAASASGGDIVWWPSQVFNPDKAVRRDGAPSDFLSETGLTAAAAEVPPRPAEQEIQIIASTKGDMLEVNRSAKGSLLMTQPVSMQKRQKVGQLEQ